MLARFCSQFLICDVSFLGIASHRGSGDYSHAGFQHLHELVRSYDTMSKYCGRCYSDTISHDISSLADELSYKSVPKVEEQKESVIAAECEIKKVLSDETRAEVPPSVTVESASDTSTDDKSPADLTDSQGTNASSIITHHILPEKAESLNKNNAANDDQIAKKVSSASNKVIEKRSSKRIPFMYDNLPSDIELQPKYSEDLTVKKKYLPSQKGRRFIRSSSIMVKSGGREVSGLDISKSKGHISRKQKDLNEAGRKSNLNVFSNLDPSMRSQHHRAKNKKLGKFKVFCLEDALILTDTRASHRYLWESSFHENIEGLLENFKCVSNLFLFCQSPYSSQG